MFDEISERGGEPSGWGTVDDCVVDGHGEVENLPVF
jgi:hypothetical protein